MPNTAAGLGVNPNDPQAALSGAAQYMRKLIDGNGGDVTKALAAYNAGQGSVDQYGGIPPFKETQKYVSDIMGRVASEASTGDQGQYVPGPTEALGRTGTDLQSAYLKTPPASDISQFGDPQLTSDEAYAACGPAAAVRFADRYGRNPTLKEAVDLARSVGWTPQQGMAGLGSEKALMDKLQVPTKLVNGPQWDTFAQEAQTGNPVTISTQGHYFFADGFNPTTGAFHVGRSGLDLKGGAEWMTPDQMTNLMGPVQGGLLADNPTVPTPSTADQTTDPAAWLGRQKDALGSSIGNGVSAVQGWASGLGTAADAILSPPAGQPAGSQPMPSDALTNPLGTGNAPTAPPPAVPAGPLDAVKQKFSDALDALGGLFGGAGVNLTDPTRSVVGGNPVAPATAPTTGQLMERATEAGLGNPAVQDVAQNGPIGSFSSNLTGTGQDIASSGLNQVRSQYFPNLSEPNHPLNVLADLEGRDPSTLTPEDKQRLQNARLAIGGSIGGDIAGARALTEPVAAAAATAPYQSVMPAETFATPTPAGGLPSVGDAAANVNRVFTRLFTDRQVDLNQAQEAYASSLGRPLNANEMASELSRLSSDPAAEIRIDEGLKPAVQAVGNDYNALRDYVTLRSNVQVADALGNDARQFSGGMTAADSQQAIQQMQDQLGPQRFAQVQQAADQVSAFTGELRQRLVDSGVLNQQQADQMEALYPNWAKTRILDYMDNPSGGQAAGSKIGLSDRQIRNYTLQGTTRAREDPIASTVAYAHQVERMAMKNDAFNALLKIDQASPTPQLRQVAQDFTPTRDQVTMTGFVDGTKQKFVTDNKALGQAINGTSVSVVPSWVSAWQNVFKSLATSRNPVFLAGNAALDIPTYLFRTTIREGGPQSLPRVLAALAKGYTDAFQGVLQGEYRGATADFLRSGGGQAGYFTGDEGTAAQTVASLQRGNVFEINSKGDLLRMLKDAATLQPVASLGERVELGPRVAAFNLAKARGANAVQATTEGRTVTVDFSQGGTVTKFLNQFIPFFNVGFQGPAQIVRAFRDNPRAFAATVGTLVGLPQVVTEVWNHADPQRWKDYQDVPDYVKNQGIVFMLPGDVSTDAQGNRKPGYLFIKLREMAPYAAIARDATDVALGDNQRAWQEMATSVLSGLSPTNASSVSQVGAEPLAGIPVAPAALQLQQNRDFFRNRDIVTARADQNASGAAKTLAPAFQRVADAAGLNAEIRPSAIDFLIRDQGAGVGGAALGASDLGSTRQDQTAQSLPVIGGLVSRFSGTQTGQGLQSARDEGLTTSGRQILRDNGITTTPGTVSGAVNGIPLKQDEEAQYQQLFNRYSDDAIHQAVRGADWGRLTQMGKNSRMQNLIDAARTRAGNEVLTGIPAAEKQRRLRAGSSGPAAVAAR
jgi:hypothetical protein